MFRLKILLILSWTNSPKKLDIMTLTRVIWA